MIPDDILNFDASKLKKVKKKDDSKYINEVKKSNFLITINPNVSHTVLDTVEKRRAFAQAMLNIDADFKQQLESGNLVIPKGKVRIKTKPIIVATKQTQENKEQVQTIEQKWIAPKLLNYVSKLEIGSERGFMHIHAMVSFDGVCHIDVVKAPAFLSQKYGRKVRLDVKYYQDTKSAIEKYVNKGQNQSSDDNSQEIEINEPIPEATIERIE